MNRAPLFLLAALAACDEAAPLSTLDPAELPEVPAMDAPTSDEPSQLPETSSSDPDDGGPPAAVPYRHPLQHAPILADGRAAAVEAIDAGPGERYFVYESAVQPTEDGEPVYEGGVGIATVTPLTPERRAELARLTNKPSVSDDETRTRPPVDARMRAEIDAARPGEIARLVVTFEPPPAPPLTHELEVAIAHGEITTREDYVATRSRLRAERTRARDEAAAPIRKVVRQLGGEVVEGCGGLPCVVVDLALDKVDELAGVPGVTHVMPDFGVEENGDGLDTRNGSQIAHVVADFDGEGPTGSSNDDIWGGIIESGRARDLHYSFHDWSSVDTNRYYIQDCTTGTCSTSMTGSYSYHATAVGSTVIGDVQDGQIQGVSGVGGSGMAPEARAYMYRVGSLSNMTAAFDDIPNRFNPVHATNMSISLENHPPYDCSGDDGTSDLADALYEDGTLLVMAAGNDGGSSSSCRVEVPGSALSVFTVGGHGVFSSSYDEDDVRSGDINSSSAWGGTYVSGNSFWTMGRGRRIIDLTAHYTIGDRAQETGNTVLGGGFGGTSAAAPQVTGFALDFVDFYKDTYSDFIDNPGSLASNLTIMGDRAQPGTTTKRGWGFDNRFGAGRLKARRFDSAGLDGPYYYFNGWTCISHDEEWTFNLDGGNPFPTDYDDLKAVVWWYDPGFHRGESLDDIDLYLETTQGTLLKYSALPRENREMVEYTDIGNHNQTGLRLRIVGDNVTEDQVGCGTNSMKVFFTVYAEDGDREPAEGLDDIERM